MNCKCTHDMDLRWCCDHCGETKEYDDCHDCLEALRKERNNLAEQLDEQKKAWVLRSASLHKTIDEHKHHIESLAAAYKSLERQHELLKAPVAGYQPK